MSPSAARLVHDAAFADVLNQYGLTDAVARRHVSRVYADEYPLVQHLPLRQALEHIGKIAAMELGRPWRTLPRT